MQINYTAEPTAQQFHKSRDFVRGILGPIGSGKSVACIMEILSKAIEMPPGLDGIRRSRWACIRNTYPELKSTLIKSWQDWFPDSVCPIRWDVPITGNIKIADIGDGTGLDFEAVFLAIDKPQDVKKLLSIEFTGVWLNEAKELDKAVLDMATGRVGRYPSKKSFGPGITPWSGVIMDTNPMDEDHWYYRLAEEERPIGYRFFRQPGAVIYRDGKYYPNPAAENIKNHTNGFDYYMRQIPGKQHEWIRVYVMGDYGCVIDGRPVYPEYTDTVHCSSEVNLTPIKGSPLMLGWDFGLCYSEDTEVLTESGWKFFKDVSDTERVATKNTITNMIEYHVPKFKVDKPYKGKMLEWISTEVNMCVTPEHIIPCRDDHKPNVLHWKSAKWLSEHNSGHWGVDLTSTPNENEEYIDPMHYGMNADILAGLLGIYLAEGSTERVGDSYRITIHQNSRCEVIDKLLSLTGLEWTYFDYGKTGGWRVTNNELGRWLYSLGHAKDKRIPRIIAELPAKYLRLFIGMYTLGDGHIRIRPNGSEEHTIFTTSALMASDMQEVAQKVGWNSSVRIIKPQTSVIVENGVSRTIKNNGGYSIAFKKSSTFGGLRKKNFKEIDYDGRVYCLNVPYHTLYVRRGGRAHWNGNTPCCIIGQLTSRGKLLILDELTSESMGIRQFANEIVVPYLSSNYKDFDFYSVADPAGVQRGQNNEATCLQELAEAGIPTDPAWTNDMTARREAVAGFLNKMVDGQPAFALSPKCKMLRKGFLGGYQFRRMQVSGGKFADKPEKNEYSHPHDALQYLALALEEKKNRAAKARARIDKSKGRKLYQPVDNCAGY